MATLVVHSGGIGDFLLACPAIATLPPPVELLGNPERLNLAVLAGIAARAHDLDALGFHTLLAAPAPHLVEFLSRFDRVVVWMRDDDGRLATSIGQCGVPRVDCFPGLPAADWDGHASGYYANCLGSPLVTSIRLDIEPDDSRADVVIHPGSGDPAKNWPIDRFDAIAQELRRDGRHLTQLRGPAERARDTGVLTQANSTLEGSLEDIARTLAGAALYVGNDSGITHLAAAVGCPTVAIFGPSDSARWAPRGPHTRVVRGAPWPAPEEVLATCRDLIRGGK